MDSKFSMGDFAYLKSGGPRMLVSSISYEGHKAKMIRCVWFDENTVPQSYEFPIECLFTQQEQDEDTTPKG